MATTTAARDIAAQRAIDRHRHGRQAMLLARMGAVIAAQRALAERHHGALPALRQALIDLAAIAQALADELPMPDSPAQ